MLMAKNNVNEYNAIMAMSLEDYIIRLKLYVEEISQIKEQNEKMKAKRK